MAQNITLDLDIQEAHILLNPLSQAILDEHIRASKASGEVRDHAELRAQMLNRVLDRLTDELFPDRCTWLDEEVCERPIKALGVCSFHLPRKQSALARAAA